ncbi:cytochrome-c peroxidase [Flavobacterium pectinovorum]|uniref:Methylamine utilization protein MauG n=1 Tax=Flavobacterium pectinovorum TaxID=29533 RepID=A0AB36NWH7_9FLAO|nr:cytochrome c peroxidase [Flavobacterium pectinovorum]OXB00926.1 cytochrome-c peroxidase [Flavobacterium pectinovorum]SHN18234.1 cytochrome c peroxidase [Flavobacterium pectinovorum]
MKLKTLIIPIALLLSLTAYKSVEQPDYIDITELRKLYSNGDASKWPAAELHESIDKSKFEDIGVLPAVPYPDYNPYSKEKEALGKILFFDPRLSLSGQIACASCHNPELGWTDNLTRSFGHDRQTGKRNSMTILNSAYAKTLFWDGRAKSLEDQAQFPIGDPLEMNEKLTIAVDKIAKIKGYNSLFTDAFGDKTVNLQRIQYAIATFERSINSPKSKFDNFISGKSEAFTDAQVKGLHLFRTKAQCINCHNTPYFSDNQFHNDGQTLFGTKNEDFGRYNVTKDVKDIGKFRTPTLREVANTKPWMHHGHFPSLLDVVELYNGGNPSPVQKKYLGTARDSLIPKVDPMLKKLNLNKEEISDLLAFIETLSTPTRRIMTPIMPK